MLPKNPKPTNNYPTVPLSKVRELPIGRAKYQEPVFTKGIFTGEYIEVIVELYPLKREYQGITYVAVRFGQMDVLRFVDDSLLYDKGK